MKMPVSIRPKFIGKLLKLQAEHFRDKPTFERLCIAVQQCRAFNSGTKVDRERLWPYMIRTQQDLAQRGVVVG